MRLHCQAPSPRREIATYVIGKIQPLPQSELQRLGALARAGGVTGPAGGGSIGGGGLLSSFLSLVDINKQAALDSMPFQPLLSPLRRPAAPESLRTWFADCCVSYSSQRGFSVRSVVDPFCGAERESAR